MVGRRSLAVAVNGEMQLCSGMQFEGRQTDRQTEALQHAVLAVSRRGVVAVGDSGVAVLLKPLL